MHCGRVLKLEGEEHHENFHRPDATVHEVAVEKDRVRWAWEAADLLQGVHEVEKLAMNVPIHRNLRTGGNADAFHCLFCLDDVQDVRGHEVDIFHGQLANVSFVQGEEASDESVVDLASVVWASIAWRNWQTLCVATERRHIDRVVTAAS
jgi:hypothetical protein